MSRLKSSVLVWVQFCCRWKSLILIKKNLPEKHNNATEFKFTIFMPLQIHDVSKNLQSWLFSLQVNLQGRKQEQADLPFSLAIHWVDKSTHWHHPMYCFCPKLCLIDLVLHVTIKLEFCLLMVWWCWCCRLWGFLLQPASQPSATIVFFSC